MSSAEEDEGLSDDTYRHWEEYDRLEAEADALKLPEAEGSWMQPLRDFAIGSTVYRWFRFEYEEGELNVCACGQGEPLGEQPAWLEEHPPEDIVQDTYSREANMPMAIEQGIAPGQPFLVKFLEPEWRRTSYECDEWDVDHHWTVVRVMPVKPKTALHAWERTLKRIRHHEDKIAKRQAHFARMQLALTHRWVMTQMVNKGYTSRKRESVTLRLFIEMPKSGGGYHCFAEGHAVDAIGAFKILLNDFKRSYPNMDTRHVLGAFERSQFQEPVQFSQWDRLSLGLSVL